VHSCELAPDGGLGASLGFCFSCCLHLLHPSHLQVQVLQSRLVKAQFSQGMITASQDCAICQDSETAISAAALQAFSWTLCPSDQVWQKKGMQICMETAVSLRESSACSDDDVSLAHKQAGSAPCSLSWPAAALHH